MQRFIISFIVAASFAVAAPAMAQSPAGDAYGGQGGVQGETTTQGQLPDSGGVAGDNTTQGELPDAGGADTSTPVHAANAGKGLPFTGLDLTLLVGGGLGLLGLGLGIRRLSRPLA